MNFTNLSDEDLEKEIEKYAGYVVQQIDLEANESILENLVLEQHKRQGRVKRENAKTKSKGLKKVDDTKNSINKKNQSSSTKLKKSSKTFTKKTQVLNKQAIEEDCSLTTASCSRMISFLTGRGRPGVNPSEMCLIKKYTDPGNKRRYMCSLTPKGEQLVSIIKEQIYG